MSKRKGNAIKIPNSDVENEFTYIDYYNRLKELALNVFKWKNLPDTVDERFLELTLYEQGYCVYFNDPHIGNLALTCTIGGRLNVYRIPINRMAISVNGYKKDLTERDSVLIFNNYLHTPTDLTIRLYAKRLYEIQRAIDVNVLAQKTPILILADEKERLTLKNMYMQYDGNQPVIYGSNSLDPNALSVLKTDAPYVADDLMVLLHQVWNEALTFLGIENSNADKRERLVSDEVSANYGHIEAQRNVMLNSRKQAVKQINKMFGTNIEVGFRSNLKTLVNSSLVEKEDIVEDIYSE